MTSPTLDSPLSSLTGIGKQTATKLEEEKGISTIKELLQTKADFRQSISDTRWRKQATTELLSLSPSPRETNVKSVERNDLLLYFVATEGECYDSSGTHLENPFETGEYIDNAQNRLRTVLVSGDKTCDSYSINFTNEHPTFFLEMDVKGENRYVYAQATKRDVDPKNVRFKKDVLFTTVSKQFVDQISALFNTDFTNPSNFTQICFSEKNYPLQFHPTERESMAVIAPLSNDEVDNENAFHFNSPNAVIVDYKSSPK